MPLHMPVGRPQQLCACLQTRQEQCVGLLNSHNPSQAKQPSLLPQKSAFGKTYYTATKSSGSRQSATCLTIAKHLYYPGWYRMKRRSSDSATCIIATGPSVIPYRYNRGVIEAATKQQQSSSSSHLECSGEGIDGGSIQVVAGLIQKQQVAGHQGKGRQGHSGLLAPTQVPCKQACSRKSHVNAFLQSQGPCRDSRAPYMHV